LALATSGRPRLGFRDWPAEPGQRHRLGLGAAPLIGVERVDRGQFAGRELEVEDGDVLGDALRLPCRWPNS
jgi:hypothetical protein